MLVSVNQFPQLVLFSGRDLVFSLLDLVEVIKEENSVLSAI